MNDAELRKQMVETQLMPRGIKDPATIESMLKVPRHLFVAEHLQPYAYDDCPHNIGYKQVISQPYIVGLMTQAAKAGKDSKVLEIGTGSGYQAAVLSLIAKEVYTVERIPELAKQAQERFKKLEYFNIHLKVTNGSLGWPENGPYDAIVVTAGAPVVPESLVDQIVTEGRIVIPVGDFHYQELYVYQKTKSGSLEKTFLEHVCFVPLFGEEGW